MIDQYMRLRKESKSTRVKTRSTGLSQRFSRKKKLILGVAITIVFGTIGALLFVFSHASVIPTQTYTSWQWNPPASTAFWELEHELVIEDVSANGAYFWSHQFGFLNGDGGYMGLQNNGNTVSGQYNTKVAVFSIFSAAIDATPGNCKIEYGNFDGGAGAGTSCRIPYNWTFGHRYKMRTVIGQNSDAAGTWWDGYITDLTSGVETQIGYIKVPKSWSGINSSIMWTEFFSARAASCETHPYSRVRFYTPKGNYGTTPLGRSNTLSSVGNCSNSKITDTADGVIHEVGNPEITKPYGVYGITCKEIMGWAKDRDTTGPIDVHAYFENEAGKPGAIGWNLGSANRNNGSGDYHDFYKSMTDPSIPINPFDGAVHRVWVYGINAGGGTNNLLQSSSGVNTFGPCAPAQSPGDADSNGVVNLDDLLAVINNWNGTGKTRMTGDLVGGNGVVNLDDLLDVINHWPKPVKL